MIGSTIESVGIVIATGETVRNGLVTEMDEEEKSGLVTGTGKGIENIATVIENVMGRGIEIGRGSVMGEIVTTGVERSPLEDVGGKRMISLLPNLWVDTVIVDLAMMRNLMLSLCDLVHLVMILRL